MKSIIFKHRNTSTFAAMSPLILFITLLMFTAFGYSQDEGVTIVVSIDNVTSNEGKVLMSLHTSETFMKGKGIQDAETEIKDGKVTVTFNNVLPGEYAILALHDANNNKRMDYQDNGMPKESFGISNNVMAMGPPRYDEAKFSVKDENLKLNIRF